ncbi:MAG: hypothetical protein DWQ35_20800 [Planctomycetota bacterium]|nr:MAG: hypothetical protein DWQ35_20800 [Planctomycetota bacterium]REK26455.1 MAG: hypothetical protein DWQ42_09010 [Planctomycetota bacterium]REK38708.1 MAG: hypothetical protein DWQ46_19965 [Planctomycetota bacterium]
MVFRRDKVFRRDTTFRRDTGDRCVWRNFDGAKWLRGRAAVGPRCCVTELLAVWAATGQSYNGTKRQPDGAAAGLRGCREL